MKSSVGLIWYFEIIKIRWGLNIQELVCGEKDFKFDSGFIREPVIRSQYRRNLLSF